jgi:hypothetical protein
VSGLASMYPAFDWSVVLLAIMENQRACDLIRWGCSGGYEWADAQAITDPSKCEAILRRSPNRTSFYEGCVTYTEDPSRGADEDDDGEEIG